MHRFKNLEIWKASRILCATIYEVTSNFPENEKFGLTNQLRRASVSVPSNIAEGCSRSSNKDLSRFLEISIGSLYEIETQLLISFDLGYLNEEKLDKTISEIEIILKMIINFRKTVNAS